MAAAALTGAAASGAEAAGAGGLGPGCHPEWAVLAHHAGGQVVTPPGAVPVACGVDTGYASSESSIAVTGAGSLIYSPAQTENSMARSTDQGANWSLTYPADEQPTSFWNTVDPFVIADRRTGRVFWTHVTGPVRNEGGLPQGSGFLLAAAYGFQVYTSTDDGRSWSTADYQTAPMGDWEKLFTGPPPPPSSGAAQPVGYPDIVYICANSPVEVAGPGRLCYKSLDGGRTFVVAGYNSPSAGEPQDTCPPLNFNNGVADSRGTIYIPATCGRSDYVAVSHDEGSTYTWIPVKDAPTGTVLPSGYLQLAIDDADTLYAIWPANGLLYLEVSRDRGASWSPPMMIAAPGVHDVQRPAVAAGAAGHVGVTYYASTDPNAQRFTAYITQTDDALASNPLFYSGPINDPAQPIFHDYGLTGASPRVDFIGGAYDATGTRFWAGVVRQLSAPDANGHLTTTGYVGRLALPAVAGGAVLLVPAGPQSGSSSCLGQARLTFHINAVPHGRVVRARAYVNGRRVVSRRGRNLTSISFARPPAPTTLRVRIVTTNNKGGRVITRRTFQACARTPVRGRVRRHRRGG